MEIKLAFNKTLTGLAGFKYGEQIYDEQAKDNINWDDDITLIFPDYIKIVAISFVQGFFNGIVEKWGFNETIKRTTIKASTPELVESIQNSMLSLI